MTCNAQMIQVLIDADNNAASAYYAALTRVGTPEAAIEHARMRSEDYGWLLGQFAAAALESACPSSNGGVLVLDQDLQDMLNDMFPEDNREEPTVYTWGEGYAEEPPDTDDKVYN